MDRRQLPNKKIDPDDVDFVVDVRIDRLVSADQAQAKLLQELAAHAYKDSRRLQSFVMFTAPVGHKGHAASVAVHNRWHKDFGISLIAKQPKGIALVEVLP